MTKLTMETPLQRMIAQGAHAAWERMMHDKYVNDDAAWQRNHGGPNPFAPTEEQRKLAEEMEQIDPREIERMLNSTEMSPALKRHLDEQGLTPDAPEEEPETYEPAQLDYSAMTVKQLRPIASTRGMKGARIAKRDELIEFLEAH